ncbi:RNA polymerase sigma factor [Clostridium butyricum]|uniref:RNA polymerase sigma-70 factor, ECF n=1 Tax=Clostridium butyricum E4 str. BoNT E BL5262 TaxID=632245 RepID=C4IGJ8_CLOBU|nr:sigma-70 family RNA polymerase sigma factor [Clostridium butyricum]APF22756.1 RNA polymerase sigma factor, sigma-70 family protein [Clostridium butyricum]EDT75943.1 putative RNA polymerase sigma-70 factor, ECF subfamily [Clostridium butyricum 5521]EEP53722.1 RNA polymerase sigma-70 factor, ECF [Clostridium butyricum E4 str. BoNT E BL5262]NFL33472.1 sigma-70 family RNA polymerase sigma factor [Clostridium butyricum]NFS18628.1 sigma-70 family RNA polymerase sigma factor [Clostridium butyricum
MNNKSIDKQFNDIYDSTYRKIQIYVTYKCSETEDIGDIMQETYMKLYKVLKKKGVDYIENPEAFIMDIAKKSIFNHYSVKQKLKHVICVNFRRDDNDYTGEEIEKIDDFFKNSIEENIISKDRLDEIWGYLESKPEETKKVFYLFYYGDMSIKNIAHTLNMNESTVKTKIYRTTNEIRNKFGRRDE